MSIAPRRVLSALALLTAIGCGDDDGSGPTGSITLSASPSALTVQQGGSGTVTVTLVRGGGFADPVNVAVTGLPSGVTLTVTPAQLTGTTTQAVVTVNVANSVPAGTYPATVTATATGIGSATASYTLTVTALPTYALTATPAAVSVGQGGSGTTTIGVTRTSFTSPVTLTLDAPPAGITGSFNPTPATGDQSVLTINVASTVAPGNHTLTVRGTATGQADKTTTVALTVTGPANYSLAATPSAVTISAGGNGTTTVDITRTNFTGAVTLSLDAPPAGITATFNPAAPTTNSSVATIAVASTVTPGNYNVTIKGTGSAGDRTTIVAVTVTAAASFTLAASPSALSLAPGGSGNSTVTIVRTNLTADIALTLVSPPAGITGVFTPATLTGTTLTSTLAINVASTVVAGVYPITVQGVGGSLTRTAVVTVTVAAGASVSLSFTPAALSIQQGGSGSTTLNATRSNYTGTITPSVAGAPAGLTLTFNPNPLTGNSAAVTVNVGAGVAVGTHNLTITGASGAAGNPTAPLAVTVTAATGGSNFVWEFCNADGVPLKFWRQSGGTWTEVAPTVVGNLTRFSFTISSTSGGVAFTLSNTGPSVRNSFRTAQQRSSFRGFTKLAREKANAARMKLTNQTVNQSSPFFDTFVILGLASELSGYGETCVTTTPTLVSKTFNVSGIAASESGQLGYGPGAAALTSATPSYNVMVEAGSYDWLAAFGPTPGFPDLNYNWSAYRLGRNEPAPGAAVAINRVGATAFTTFPFTVTGGSSGSTYFFSQSLSGARGHINSFSIGSLLGTMNTGTALFLSPGDRLGTDLLSLNITNANTVGTVTDFRNTVRYLGSAPPASGSFALPQAVPAFVVSAVAGAPVPTWSAAGSIPTDYQGATSSVGASFTGANSGPLYTITATRGWLTANGMSTNYTLAGPILPGFLAAWAPGAPLDDSSVIMFGSFGTTAPVAGTVINFAFRLQD